MPSSTSLSPSATRRAGTLHEEQTFEARARGQTCRGMRAGLVRYRECPSIARRSHPVRLSFALASATSRRSHSRAWTVAEMIAEGVTLTPGATALAVATDTLWASTRPLVAFIPMPTVAFAIVRLTGLTMSR
jgi:hypothetical protein